MSLHFSPCHSALAAYLERKPYSWSDPSLLSPALEQRFQAELAKLPVIYAPAGSTPLDFLAAWPQVRGLDGITRTCGDFVVHADGSWFYCDTEGFEYGRYAIRLAREPAPPTERS